MVVPLRASQLRRLRRKERVHISTGLDIAQILLYDAKPCTAGTDWATDSPYLTSVRQQLAQRRADLVERAAKLPLIVIDWDKTTDKSHGRKVLNVVENVLDTVLQVPELKQRIQFVALAPVTAADKKAQLALLKAYKQERLKGFRPVDLKEPFERAEKWVKQYDEKDLARNEINDLVLQAILWEHLRKPAWINMSFGVLSSALELQVLRTEQLRKSPSFVVMAAGNDPVPLNQQSIPQLGASLSRRFVNVTHGLRSGDILGTFSNPAQLATVSVLAPGCGYPFLPTTESGSSFASPYVATASWVAALLSGTADAADRMRESIVLASRPLPVLRTRIESGGAFDPALLLTTRRAHVIRTDGTLAVITGIEGSFSYLKQAGDERTVKITAPSAAADRTLVVHTTAAADHVWFREIDNQTCALTDSPAGDVKLVLTLDTGGTIVIKSAAEFRSTLRELWF